MRPRIRSVKPEMRQDERYAKLSYPARELFNGLITMADDEGRLRALTSGILGHVFPYDDDAVRKIKGWVGEIKASGMVVFYVDEGTPYGAFRHWAKHQKINRPSPSELPPPPDRKIVEDNGLVKTDKGWKQSTVLTDPSSHGHGVVTEFSLSLHDLFSESSRSDHVPPRGCAFRSDPDQVRSVLRNGQQRPQPESTLLLSALLDGHILRHDPKAEPKAETAKWLNDMRLLVEDRKGDIDEISRVIDWCQADDFERSNVLSPGKLRSRFTQLVLKATPHSTAGRVVPISSRPRDSSKYNRAAGL